MVWHRWKMDPDRARDKPIPCLPDSLLNTGP